MGINNPSFVTLHEGYRWLTEGEKIQEGDIVLDDIFYDPQFKIGPKHAEIGKEYGLDCVPMVRKI